jgi:hypothetical protein
MVFHQPPTTPEPDIHICAKCKKPIIGEYILLFGQRMHPEVRSKGHGQVYCNEERFLLTRVRGQRIAFPM